MLAYRAMLFARKVHETQRRKYTGNPYSDHLAEVAGIVATIAHRYEHLSECVIAAAWLHDCVEDQGVSAAVLEHEFGGQVAEAVFQLSDLENGNRAERKAASRVRLAGAWSWVQSIKVADVISNTGSISEHDAKFAAIYLEEKRLLLDVLKKADPTLLALARTQTDEANQSLQLRLREKPTTLRFE